MNTEKIKERMKEKGISPAVMSKEMGMNVSTWYRKMQKDGDGFSVIDLLVFKRVLELTGEQALDFLLDEKPHKCEKGA